MADKIKVNAAAELRAIYLLYFKLRKNLSDDQCRIIEFPVLYEDFLETRNLKNVSGMYDQLYESFIYDYASLANKVTLCEAFEVTTGEQWHEIYALHGDNENSAIMNANECRKKRKELLTMVQCFKPSIPDSEMEELFPFLRFNMWNPIAELVANKLLATMVA